MEIFLEFCLLYQLRNFLWNVRGLKSVLPDMDGHGHGLIFLIFVTKSLSESVHEILGYFLSWSCPINSGKKSRQIFIFAHALPLIKFGNLLWFFLQCILVIGFFWYFGTFLDEFLGLLRIIECNEPILLSFHENSLWWVTSDESSILTSCSGTSDPEKSP